MHTRSLPAKAGNDGYAGTLHSIKKKKGNIMAKKKSTIKKKITPKKILKEIPFRPKEYISSHPHNDAIVKALKKEIKKHIKSNSKDPKKINYKNWYVGVSRKPNDDRTNSHKSTKKISELKYFKPFYARSLSNARKIENELCDEFNLKHCKVIGGLKKDSNRVYVYNHKNSPKKAK